MSFHFSLSYFHLLLVVLLFRLCLSNNDNNSIHDDVLCMDHERQALLDFKHALIDEVNRLASWVPEKKDCCTWTGIVCDNFTGHVHGIHLPDTYQIDEYTTTEEVKKASKHSLRGDLSPSLLNLKQLKHLDLSDNDFGGIQVPGFLGSLANLRYLNLSRSGFGGPIPPQLGNLTELRILCLGGTHNDSSPVLTSMRNMQWLSNLRLLHHLDMSGVDLSNTINWLQVINTLPSLVELHLSNCQLPDIHSHVPSLNLTSLSLLDLSSNYFSNSFVPQWIFSTLTSLVSLDLSGCSIQGPIPPGSIDSFRNMTSLELLRVPGNGFMNSSLVLEGLSGIGGNLILLDISSCGVSSSVLNSLHNLTSSLLSLDLSENQLTNKIPKSWSHLCNLRHIDLGINQFSNISLSSLFESLLKCKSPRLESLSLASSGISGMIPDSIGRLRFLRSLVLHGNLISGRVPYSIGGLSSLELLDISYNQLNGSLPDSLGQLSKLKSLSISNNQLNGRLPNSLGQLSKLISLHLSDNQLNGSLPNSLGQLSMLNDLNLSSNQLNGSLAHIIGQLSKLNTLDLSYNQLSGSIPHSLGHLSELDTLDLSYNQLSGSLPDTIGQLSKLNYLDLSNNQLNGSLPHSLGDLSKLISLHFSSNLFTGVVTEVHFAKLARLSSLVGQGNNLTLRPHIANWIPSFGLRLLSLGSWDLGPQFPLWLQLHRNLMLLNISNTRISSTMPKSFWKSLPNLQFLDMSRNHLQGMLLDIPATIAILDLSSNKFKGKLPALSNTSYATILDLSNNSFVGSLRHLVCPYAEQSLAVLNLANNHLSGFIPECWMKWSNLQFLNLENNNLSGRIPRTLGSLSSLLSLNMCNNKLSGRLPVSLKNLRNLQILQLARNELVGRVPSWFGRQFSSLRILNLRSNHFDGHINVELCYLNIVQILDISDNNLSGNIPRCFNNFSVLSGKETSFTKEFVYAHSFVKTHGSASLMIKGREDTYGNFLGLVMMLDLSSNNLSGSIPSELMALRALQSLNISSNQLTGRIPEKIGELKLLESFDVSQNQLSGELPLSLSSLSFLSSFNVSYNSLTGRVPTSTQLQSFNESSFLGNKLCGEPLTQSCAVEVPDHRDPEEEDDGSHGVDWGLIISIVSGFIVGFWVVLAPLILSTTWRIAYFNFLSDKSFMFYDAIHKYCFNIFHK